MKYYFAGSYVFTVLFAVTEATDPLQYIGYVNLGVLGVLTWLWLKEGVVPGKTYSREIEQRMALQKEFNDFRREVESKLIDTLKDNNSAYHQIIPLLARFETLFKDRKPASDSETS